MSIFNQISLTMFSTTLGHQSDKWIYKHVLNHTDKVIGLNNFADRRLAIKVHNGEEDIFNEIVKDYKNFTILKEIGNIGLSDNPHANIPEYSRYLVGNYNVSISNIYSLVPFRGKYNLWLEDDCLIWTHDFSKLSYYFEEAIKVLESKPEVFSINMNGPLHGVKNNQLFQPTKFAFRPFLARSKDLYDAANVFKANYSQLLNVHPELTYETIIRHLYQNPVFLEWNPEYGAYHEYIGAADKEEVKKRLNL